MNIAEMIPSKTNKNNYILLLDNFFNYHGDLKSKFSFLNEDNIISQSVCMSVCLLYAVCVCVCCVCG